MTRQLREWEREWNSLFEEIWVESLGTNVRCLKEGKRERCEEMRKMRENIYRNRPNKFAYERQKYR